MPKGKPCIRIPLLNICLLFVFYFLFLKFFTDESFFKMLSSSLDSYHLPEFNWKYYR
ncbi:hypothetical protein MYP_3804 [Sporocytophaga myxococcoides]|uniref:Uncharacterized protein n=1 Tax=Sporocytophaga myxococcoides TaxID=153721 RepID=A0A098LJC4_9BACT|nr:hypothetical protein MYP_3804 [Sporocytophaga myxococcoides]